MNGVRNGQSKQIRRNTESSLDKCAYARFHLRLSWCGGEERMDGGKSEWDGSSDKVRRHQRNQAEIYSDLQDVPNSESLGNFGGSKFSGVLDTINFGLGRSSMISI